jgi:hypothetical protein
VIEHVTLLDGTHAPQADKTVATDGERIETAATVASPRGFEPLLPP